MTKIKFCGNRDPKTAFAINDILPDYVGFILSPRFKRFIPLEIAAEFKSALDKRIKTVGVFVDEPYEYVEAALKSEAIDIAQLHGLEDESFIERLKKSAGKPIIKAFKIESAEDVLKAAASSADYVLLDSGTGTGKSFDWSLIKNIGREFFLAGGLCPENVSGAIEKCRPFAVDVSSGIETDSVKDPEKMRKFAAAVRRIKE